MGGCAAVFRLRPSAKHPPTTGSATTIRDAGSHESQRPDTIRGCPAHNFPYRILSPSRIRIEKQAGLAFPDHTIFPLPPFSRLPSHNFPMARRHTRGCGRRRHCQCGSRWARTWRLSRRAAGRRLSGGCTGGSIRRP